MNLPPSSLKLTAVAVAVSCVSGLQQRPWSFHTDRVSGVTIVKIEKAPEERFSFEEVHGGKVTNRSFSRNTASGRKSTTGLNSTWPLDHGSSKQEMAAPTSVNDASIKRKKTTRTRRKDKFGLIRGDSNDK